MTTEMIISTPSAVPAYSNKMLATATEKVFKIGETVRKCAFETAAIMAQVDAAECFKDDGFNSVHEWAMKTFGFKKSASYTLLRIGKEYTRQIINARGKVEGYGSNLLPESAETDFTTTQIEKMLPGGHDLAVELVESEEITPGMTCKEIEKVIKAHTAPEPEDPEQDETEPEQDGGGANKPEPETVIVAVIDTDGYVTEPRYKIPVEVLEKYRV